MRAPLLLCSVLLACAASAKREASPDRVAPVCEAAMATSVESGTRPDAEHPAKLLLRNARLIDGTGAKPRDRIDVLVEGDRIAKIGASLSAPDDARVIDLDGRTLLPGFIDAHVHLTMSPPPSYAEGVVDGMQEHDADRALEGVANAWATLSAGFTTVRNVGGGFADRALRDAIDKGTVPGPRMLVANHSIGISGGHCDETNTFRPGVLLEAESYRFGVADSPDEVRKAVRYQIKHGADVIKLCATGGVMSQGDAVGSAQLTIAEMKAAVDEAVRADRKVAAHAHGNLGIREAIEAGVHSIEHGSVLDKATVELMKRRGTFLVPTLSAGEHVVAAADAGRLSLQSAAKAREIAPKMKQSFGLAYAAGVRIALGSDAGVFPHGKNGHELTLMVAGGMKPMDAIVAGTSAAAELLGRKDVGRIAEGQLADLVVVEGDPLQAIDVVESPAMVVKGGVVYVPPRWETTTCGGAAPR
jgi:imidazolonepropionase-like amidohydrolase